MATYNDNNVYLSVDGVDVSAYFTDQLTYDETTEEQDTTAGANADYRTTGNGLRSLSLRLMLVHDTADWNSYKSIFVPDAFLNVIYGPNGNTQGEPKFEGVCTITDGPRHVVSIDKTKVAHEVTFKSSQAPVATIYRGHTF